MSVLPSVDALLIVALGGAVGAGVLLLVRALVPPQSVGPSTGSAAVTRLRELVARAGRRGLIAVAVGVVMLAVTRWVVAGVAVAVLAFAWPALFGGARAERAAMERLEGLAAWTESLRDTIAGAVGLEQAIPATAHAAAPSVAGPLQALSDRLRVRTPLPAALARFAEDLDDASADLVVSALVLNSRLRGPGLRQVLTSLAESVRADLDARRRIAAGRASTRRSVQIVVGVTVAFVGGLILFNRGYLEPYTTVAGQVVLATIFGLFAAGFAWMRRLSRFVTPERFLRPGQLRVGS
ncbi:MAG: type II secretion system F family protein [Angustibacter sp.]